MIWVAKFYNTKILVNEETATRLDVPSDEEPPTWLDVSSDDDIGP